MPAERQRPPAGRRGRPPAPITPEKSALSRLGRALRKAREAAGVSLSEFAKSSTYSASHLSRVEHGQATPSRELVAAYEAQFHTDGLLLSHYRDLRAEQTTARQARRGATDVMGSDPPPSRVPARTAPGDRSSFVADVTVPDGTIVTPGTHLTKTWRLRNAGSVPWSGRALERDGATSGTGTIGSPHRVPVADTQPGEEVEITVELTAPSLAGSTVAHWRMVDAAGRPCFPDRYAEGIYVQLVVRELPQSGH